jgi:hypothetical protein
MTAKWRAMRIKLHLSLKYLYNFLCKYGFCRVRRLVPEAACDQVSTLGDILAECDILRSSAGPLVARDRQVEEVLHDAFKAAEHGDAAIGTKGIAVPLIAWGKIIVPIANAI